MRVPNKHFLILFGVLLLSGCAQFPTASNSAINMPVHAAHTPFPPNLSSALTARSGYTVLQLEQSPWGPSVNLDVSPIYYAASGRICREMSVTQQGTALKDDVIACQYGDLWGYTRNVTKSLSSN